MTWSGVGGGNFASAGGLYSRWWRQLLPQARFDFEAYAGDTWRNSAIAIGLAWIADNFAEPKPLVYYQGRDGHDRPLDNHDFYNLAANPNDGYDWDVLCGATVLSIMCDGNGYWRKVFSRAGLPVGLWYIPHWQMFPQWPTDGSAYITGYTYVVDGKKFPLRRDEVVHFRIGLDPYNTRVGLTPIRAVLREIATDNDAAGFLSAIMRNMGVPGLVISPADGATIEADEQEVIRQQWREDTTADNRGNTVVAPVGVKIEKVSFTPREMMIGEAVVGAEARILAAMKLSPLLFDLPSSNGSRSYANKAEARRGAYEDCLIPLQKSFARQFTRQMPEIFGPRERMGWDYRGVQALKDDAKAVAERATKLFESSVITRARALTMIGEDTADGEADEVYYVKKGIQFVHRDDFEGILIDKNEQLVDDPDPKKPEGDTKTDDKSADG